METMCDYSKWFYVVMFLIFVILAGLVMIFKYFLNITREGVILKNNDKQHEHKHHQNEIRIKELEKNNGKGLKEIERLNGKITTLEGIIKEFIENKK